MNRLQIDKREITRLVSEYVSSYGVTSVREIAEYVYDNSGMRPSTATVSIILQRLGYKPTTKRVWNR